MRTDAPDRIQIEPHHPHNSYHPSKALDKVEMTKFESTPSGDAVGSSYDSEVHRVSDPATCDEASRSLRRPVHRRDLSAHFFDATRLNDDFDDNKEKRQYPSQHARPQRDRSQPQDFSGHQSSPPRRLDGGAAAFALAANAPPMSPSINVGNKHRRGPSGGFTNPSVAHRRINSIGDSTPIDRYGYSGGFPYYPPARTGYHRREDSAGLDILSAVADESKEQLEMAAGKRRPGKTQWHTGEPSSSIDRRMISSRKVPMNSSYERPAGSSYLGQYGYNGPPPAHAPIHYYHHEHYYSPPGPPQSRYPRGPPYPVQYAPLKAPQHYHPNSNFSSGNSDSRLDIEKKAYDSNESIEWPSSAGGLSGSQTLQAPLGADDENRPVMSAPVRRRVATNPESGDHLPNTQNPGHHRKLSSYSSLGALLGSALFPDPEQQGQSTRTGTHHRSTSSSVSLLQGLEGDIFFLQNIQTPTPNGSQNTSFPNPRPAESNAHHLDVIASNEGSGHLLAAGGTSKRIRRKCTVGDCANRVVQGGLCISHGAKRKTCQHPGCNKNVKKAGMCSTHGPARKRCETRGCGKVAVQGGRCIAHGAKKKLCECEGCNKQAILSGMCKKHYDASTGTSSANQDGCVVIDDDKATRSKAPDAIKPSHARGLSIFQELSAESVQNLFSGEDVAGSVHPLKDN